MHNIINIHSNIISKKANIGFLIPKNIMLHKAFNTICIENIIAGIFILKESDSLHTRKNEMPIIKYKVIQTGPNR